jgi:hypothetical protein
VLWLQRRQRSGTRTAALRASPQMRGLCSVQGYPDSGIPARSEGLAPLYRASGPGSLAEGTRAAGRAGGSPPASLTRPFRAVKPALHSWRRISGGVVPRRGGCGPGTPRWRSSARRPRPARPQHRRSPGPGTRPGRRGPRPGGRPDLEVLADDVAYGFQAPAAGQADDRPVMQRGVHGLVHGRGYRTIPFHLVPARHDAGPQACS